MKAARIFTLAIAAALVLLAGTFSAASAGRRVIRNAETTASVPAPVVDETPINPDTGVKIKPQNSPKNNPQGNLPPKKRFRR